MSNIQTVHDVRHFCEAINASLGLSRSEREDTLKQVPVPAGFRVVILRYADEAKPVVVMSSTKGTLSAADIACSMTLKNSTCITADTPRVYGELDGSILDLIINDGRRPGSRYLLGRR